jgi:hypothetical protein
MKKPVSIVIVIAVLVVAAGVIWWLIQKRTPIPAVVYRTFAEVDIIDPWEFFGEAEMYLTVQQSSRPDTDILVPMNVGKMPKYHAYVELPFVPNDGDVLKFALLDDDQLSKAEERTLLESARVTGYVIWIGSRVYAASNGIALPPGSKDATRKLMEALAQSYVLECDRHKFQDYGHGQYIVPHERPTTPKDANAITIKKGKTAKMDIRVYFEPDTAKRHVRK